MWRMKCLLLCQSWFFLISKNYCLSFLNKTLKCLSKWLFDFSQSFIKLLSSCRLSIELFFSRNSLHDCSYAFHIFFLHSSQPQRIFGSDVSLTGDCFPVWPYPDLLPPADEQRKKNKWQYLAPGGKIIKEKKVGKFFW